MNLEEMKKLGVYDYVAENYNSLSKEDLKNIILELDYSLNRTSRDIDYSEEIFFDTIADYCE